MTRHWYGWSADTAVRGLATLEQLGLLTHTIRLKKASLSPPTGLARVNRRLPHVPFGHLVADDIFKDDVINAFVYPAPPKNRPGKTRADATGKKAGS